MHSAFLQFNIHNHASLQPIRMTYKGHSIKFQVNEFHLAQEVPEIRFLPEVVVVGPDSTTGLLTRYFTVYFGIGGDSPSGTRGGGELQFINGLVGTVSVQDPIETLPVRYDTVEPLVKDT